MSLPIQIISTLCCNLFSSLSSLLNVTSRTLCRLKQKSIALQCRELGYVQGRQVFAVFGEQLNKKQAGSQVLAIRETSYRIVRLCVASNTQWIEICQPFKSVIASVTGHGVEGGLGCVGNQGTF